MKEVLKYANCFVCGDRNNRGLKARFFFDGEKAFTELVAGGEFEGYRGIFHGGIVATLLDEVMIKAILALEKYVVTAEMTVKYLAPVRIGDKLTFTGQLVRQKSRAFFTEGQVRSQDGQVLATATGKYIEAGDKLKGQLVKSVE